jgi:hypothetical protein
LSSTPRLLDRDQAEVIEFYPSREAADVELAAILHDEPGWAARFEVVVVDVTGSEAAVTEGGRSRTDRRSA